MNFELLTRWSWQFLFRSSSSSCRRPGHRQWLWTRLLNLNCLLGFSDAVDWALIIVFLAGDISYILSNLLTQCLDIVIGLFLLFVHDVHQSVSDRAIVFLFGTWIVFLHVLQLWELLLQVREQPWLILLVSSCFLILPCLSRPWCHRCVSVIIWFGHIRAFIWYLGVFTGIPASFLLEEVKHHIHHVCENGLFILAFDQLGQKMFIYASLSSLFSFHFFELFFKWLETLKHKGQCLTQ